MTKRTYERLGDKAKREEYELVLPLDAMILGALVEEGTTFGGLYEIGTTARELINKLNLPQEVAVGSRLGTLRMQGLVKRVKMLGQKKATGTGWAWQRTKDGDALLAKLKTEGSL